jgi:hypothetical protein
MAGTADDVIRVALGEVGYSRWDDPEPGTKYGRWYAELTDEPYYGTSGVPYCAMFVSWVFDQAGATCEGLPGAYCPTMLAIGWQNGAGIDPRDCETGDVVYFDWGGDDVADHVGIVLDNLGSCIETIEGNTSVSRGGSQSNGGVVARKTRPWTSIQGIIRPAWGHHEPEPVPEPQKQEDFTMECLIKPDGKDYMLYYNGEGMVRLSHPDQMAALQETYRRTHDGREMPCYDYGTKDAPWCARLAQTCKYVIDAPADKWYL